MAKKIFSAELDENVLADFTAYVNEAGYVKYRALEAAMKAFLALPQETQIELMQTGSRPDIKNLRQVLVDGLLNAEIRKEVDSLGPAKAEFLNLLLQAKAKASRGKKRS